MKTLIKRLLAFIRKSQIDQTVSEMEELQNLLHSALRGRGRLTEPQRMQVLKNLVEQVRQENAENLAFRHAELIELEKSNDISKAISISGL